MDRIRMLAAVGMFLFAGTVCADTARARLLLIGQAAGSISMVFPSGTGSLTGLGTSAVTLALGTINAQSTPAGLTLATDANSWWVTGTISVLVDKTNLTSASYTFGAQIQTTPPAGISWTFAGSVLSTTPAIVVTSTGAYAATVSYPWKLTIQNSASTGAVGNKILFTAVAN